MVNMQKLVSYLGVLVVLLYGAIMQPTPDSPSLGVLVYGLIALPFFVLAMMRVRALPLYAGAFASALLLGLLPALAGELNAVQFARDIISLAFLVLGPLSVITIIAPKWKYDEQWITLERLRLIMAIAGAMLSVRYVINQPDFRMILVSNLRADLEYLSSEPLVMFSFAYSGMMVFRAEKTWASVLFLVLFVLSAVGLVAVTYRGPLIIGGFLFMASASYFLVRWTGKRPFRALMLMALLAFAGSQAAPVVSSVYAKIDRKFTTVGSNSKVEEFLGTFDRDTTTAGALFGTGLGGRGYLEGAGTVTGYTHNVVSYFYLKMGYVGLLIVFSAIFISLWPMMSRPRLLLLYSPEVLTLCYIGLFQGAYKHFGFGLILGVCIYVCTKIRRRRHAQRYQIAQRAFA